MSLRGGRSSRRSNLMAEITRKISRNRRLLRRFAPRNDINLWDIINLKFNKTILTTG